MDSKAAPVIQQQAIAPGNVAAFDVNGVLVAIANVDGVFYAFDDTCTHEQCSLSEGVLEGTVVTCPCHGAQFDVTTGQVVAPPAPTPVRTYPVRVHDGQLTVDV